MLGREMSIQLLTSPPLERRNPFQASHAHQSQKGAFTDTTTLIFIQTWGLCGNHTYEQLLRAEFSYRCHTWSRRKQRKRSRTHIYLFHMICRLQQKSRICLTPLHYRCSLDSCNVTSHWEGLMITIFQCVSAVAVEILSPPAPFRLLGLCLWMSGTRRCFDLLHLPKWTQAWVIVSPFKPQVMSST